MTKATSIESLLSDVRDNLLDHEDGLLGPIKEPVMEMTVTLTAKLENGSKAIILADYNPNAGLTVYERYGSCERYDQLAMAFQAEVDQYKGTTTLNLEDLDES